MPLEILVDEDIESAPIMHAAANLAYATLTGIKEFAHVAEADICLRICGESVSQALNSQYRDQAKPTNVLSFPAEVEVGGVIVLGDLALCWPVIQREARTHGKTVEDHAAHLTLHGLLHLLGYDHQHPAESSIMEDLERELLASMAINDPYA